MPLPAEVTKVLIVDDHAVVRQGLRSLLSDHPSVRVVAEAASAAEALEAFERHRPQVTLLDMRLGDGTGLDLLPRLLAVDPQARVVVVSSYDDEPYVTSSLRAGAHGYVLKADSPAVLVSVIEAVAAGEQALSPRVTSQVVGRLVRGADVPELDALDTRLLRLLSEGLSNGQIAEQLFMSDTTVKRRLRTVFGKLGVSRRAEAVGVAMRRGIL